MQQKLLDLLNKIPIIVLALLYTGYLAYDYYDFLESPESELGQKKAQVQALKQQVETSKKKLATAQDFFKNLEVIRTRIRNLSQQLESTKASLTNEIDLANFIRMVTLEARKVGLTISSIRPMGDVKKEYYIEVPFAIQFRGAYVQVLVFFDRIIRLQQLVRISAFSMRPAGNTLAKYVELQGQGTLVTYKYLGSSADDVQNQEWMKNNDEGLKKIQEIQKAGGAK